MPAGISRMLFFSCRQEALRSSASRSRDFVTSEVIRSCMRVWWYQKCLPVPRHFRDYEVRRGLD